VGWGVAAALLLLTLFLGKRVADAGRALQKSRAALEKAARAGGGGGGGKRGAGWGVENPLQRRGRAPLAPPRAPEGGPPEGAGRSFREAHGGGRR
jgi:hypothetical protein